MSQSRSRVALILLVCFLGIIWYTSQPNRSFERTPREEPPALTLSPRSSKFCAPQSIALYSRVSFPKVALDVFRYRLATESPSEGASDASRRVFRAVEIGSLTCVNLHSFLTVLHAYAPEGTTIEFYSVDSWGHRGQEEGSPDQNSDAAGRAALRHCRELLNLTFPDAKLVPGLSADVAKTFPDAFFDFVYIDALHTYNAVVTDMNAWWPKLKDGGLFSGDDYGDVSTGHLAFWEKDLWPYQWGVVRGVREFSLAHGVPYAITSHEHKLHKAISAIIPKLPTASVHKGFLTPYHAPPNWYMIKPFARYTSDCIITVNREVWLSKFERPLALRKPTHRVLAWEEKLLTGWTRVVVTDDASASSSVSLSYLLYLPESITDPIEVALGRSSVPCSLLVYLHGEHEAGNDLIDLIRKASTVGTPVEILEGKPFVAPIRPANRNASTHSHPLIQPMLYRDAADRGRRPVVVIVPQSKTGWGHGELSAVGERIVEWVTSKSLQCARVPHHMQQACRRVLIDTSASSKVMVSGVRLGGKAVIELMAQPAAFRAVTTFVAVSPTLLIPGEAITALGKRTAEMITSASSRGGKRVPPRFVAIQVRKDTPVPSENAAAFMQQFQKDELVVSKGRRMDSMEGSGGMPDVLFIDLDAAPEVSGVGLAAYSATSVLWDWL